MFHYVLASASEHPSLAQGQAWPGLLSPREEEILAGLSFLPRRRKWLLGRVAAKRLVRQMHGPVEPGAVSVLNRPSGEPFVLIEGQGAWAWPISISHRGTLGLAAAPLTSGLGIGADLETIEPRDLALVRQFFTEREAALVAEAGPACDEVVARIWSAKEAMSKLLGLGLRLDTRAIEMGTLTGSPNPPATLRSRQSRLAPHAIEMSLDGAPWGDVPAGWQTIDVTLDPSLRPAFEPRSLRVVWRREAAVVLTVAIGKG